MRDKSLLTSGPLKDLDKQQDAGHEYGKREGRKLEKAIHKVWTSDKAGLPDF
jgi:hypothetical protein